MGKSNKDSDKIRHGRIDGEPFTTFLKKPLSQPPTPEFMADFCSRPCYPVLLGKNEHGWRVIDGWRRIRSVQIGKEKGLCKGDIDFILFEGLTDTEMDERAYVANQHRSANEIRDVLLLKELLGKGKDYKTVAQALHVPVSTVKNLDARWANVPQAIVNGAMAGKISPGTAVEVGKIKSGDTVKMLIAQYKKEGKLTASMVQDTRLFVKQEVRALMQPKLPPLAVKREHFSRAELEPIAALPVKEARAALVKLLG